MLNEICKLGMNVFASNLKRLPRPYKLTFAVTYKCNSRCRTCNIWKKLPKDELTTDEIRKIFEKVNPSWVNLTGGEPFLRTDLYEIAKTIRQNTKTYLFNMTTNGLCQERIIKDVRDISNLNFPKFTVVVSLDGPEKVHDKIRGVKGNWKKAVEVFKKLREFSKTNHKFSTYLGYTISEYNVGMVEETINEVRKEIKDATIDDFHFNVFHASPIYYGNKRVDLKGLKEKFLADVDYILEKKRTPTGLIPFIEKRYLQLLEKYFKTGKSPLPCKALASSVFIDPSGNVYPCTHMGLKLGNLRDFGFDLRRIWNAERAEEALKLIRNNECDGCWTPCEAYQTIFGNISKLR